MGVGLGLELQQTKDIYSPGYLLFNSGGKINGKWMFSWGPIAIKVDATEIGYGIFSKELFALVKSV